MCDHHLLVYAGSNSVGLFFFFFFIIHMIQNLKIVWLVQVMHALVMLFCLSKMSMKC